MTYEDKAPYASTPPCRSVYTSKELHTRDHRSLRKHRALLEKHRALLENHRALLEKHRALWWVCVDIKRAQYKRSALQCVAVLCIVLQCVAM